MCVSLRVCSGEVTAEDLRNEQADVDQGISRKSRAVPRQKCKTLQDSGHRVRFSFAACQILQSESGRPPALSLGLSGTWDKVKISGVNSLNVSIIVITCCNSCLVDAPEENIGKLYITWLSSSWKNMEELCTHDYRILHTYMHYKQEWHYWRYRKVLHRFVQYIMFHSYQHLSYNHIISYRIVSYLSVHRFRLGHRLACQVTVQSQQMVDHSVAAEAWPLGRTTPCHIELLRLPQIFAARGAGGMAVDYQDYQLMFKNWRETDSL